MNKWQILPLEGKYYGTALVRDDHGDSSVIKIWGAGRTGIPSSRELDLYGVSEKTYLDQFLCDSHYEDAGDYAIACAIRDCLNEKGL